MQFIARAKELGFTLAEIAALLGPDGGGSADDVVLMARNKISELDTRQKELADTRSRLEDLIDVCGDPGSEDCVALRVTSR